MVQHISGGNIIWISCPSRSAKRYVLKLLNCIFCPGRTAEMNLGGPKTLVKTWCLKKSVQKPGQKIQYNIKTYIWGVHNRNILQSSIPNTKSFGILTSSSKTKKCWGILRNSLLFVFGFVATLLKVARESNPQTTTIPPFSSLRNTLLAYPCNRTD